MEIKEKESSQREKQLVKRIEKLEQRLDSQYEETKRIRQGLDKLEKR